MRHRWPISFEIFKASPLVENQENPYVEKDTVFLGQGFGLYFPGKSGGAQLYFVEPLSNIHNIHNGDRFLSIADRGGPASELHKVLKASGHSHLRHSPSVNDEVVLLENGRNFVDSSITCWVNSSITQCQIHLRN